MLRISPLSEEQILVIKQLLCLVADIKHGENQNWQYFDARFIATKVKNFFNHFTDWNISIISSTHHTKNIIFACKPLKTNKHDFRFALKVQVIFDGKNSPLVSEAAFYQLHQDDCLPRFLGFFIEKDVCAIALEYLGHYKKFATLLWDEDIPICDAENLMQTILQYSSYDLFNSAETVFVSNSDNWRVYKEFFLNRAITRVNEKRKTKSLFNRIILLNECKINSVSMSGPVKLINEIFKEGRFIADILPHSLGSIHGDLHLGNILVDKKSIIFRYDKLPIPKFILIDPGFCKPGPIIYDLAKIYQSFCGHYEAIMRGAYLIHYSGEISFNLRFNEPPHYSSLEDAIGNCVKNISLKFECDPVKLHWICVLSAGIHLIAAAPHHTVIEQEAITMLLWGCFLANNAFEKLKSLA